MKTTFFADRQEAIDNFKNGYTEEILTEEKLSNLPLCLQKHFKLCGFVNKPIAMNADIIWNESFLKLNPKSYWKALQTLQFNAVNPIMRTAFMKLRKISFAGKDLYKNEQGSMTGKILGLFTVLKASGKEVSQSALITNFCEMMLLSGYAFQPYIIWKTINHNTLEATLKDCGTIVKGVFHFHENGLFSFFETEDRYFEEGKNKYSKNRFRAVIDSYKKIGEVFFPEK